MGEQHGKRHPQQDLLDRIQACLRNDHQLWSTRQALDEAAGRFDTLTPRGWR